MARPARLTESEIRERLAALDGWTLEEGRLHRTFVFRDFVAAFGFMSMCALRAEKLDHHPDWKNVYRHVDVQLSTHDVGGLTLLDFELAAYMNACGATVGLVES